MCQCVEDSHFNVLMVLLGVRRLVVQRLKHKREHTNQSNVPTRSDLYDLINYLIKKELFSSIRNKKNHFSSAKVAEEPGINS